MQPVSHSVEREQEPAVVVRGLGKGCPWSNWPPIPQSVHGRQTGRPARGSGYSAEGCPN